MRVLAYAGEIARVEMQSIDYVTLQELRELVKAADALGMPNDSLVFDNTTMLRTRLSIETKSLRRQ